MLFFRSSPYQEARVPIIPRLLLPSRPSSMPARRSEGSKCNPSKYNGANPHEQAPTDGLTSTWFSDPWVFKNTSFSPHYYFYLLRLLYIGLYFIRSIRSLVIIKRWWVETGLNQCMLLLGLTVKKWGLWCFGKILNIQINLTKVKCFLVSLPILSFDETFSRITWYVEIDLNFHTYSL